MYDLISIGTLTIDLFFKSETLTQNGGRFELAMGGKYFADHFYENLGGGATNVAIGVQKHGLRTSLVTLIGNNSFKKVIIDKLEASGVSYLHSKFVDDHFNISSILLSQKGEKCVINYQSPHQHLFSSPKDYNNLLRSSHIYFGNIPDVSYYEKLRILQFLRKHNRKIIMNMGVRDCRRALEQLYVLLSYVDVVILNGHEFADLIKKPYEEIDFYKNVITNRLKDFKDKLFVITDGGKGSYAYQNGNIYYHAAIVPAKILDSTGAGDGYTAGFLSEYLTSSHIEHAMYSGSSYAAKILAKIGAN